MGLEKVFKLSLFTLTLVLFSSTFIKSDDAIKQRYAKAPSVTLVLLVRNKAHILPHFLYYLQNLDYPKEKISLWIRSDHNQDESEEIVRQWLDHVTPYYKYVDIPDKTSVHPAIRYMDEDGLHHWSNLRYKYMIKLRQQALDQAREETQDYILYVDCDNLLMNPRVLWDLIDEKRPVVAPMLDVSAITYANFGDDLTKENFTSYSEEYFDILNRQKMGSFLVPVVHSTILIDLKHYATGKLGFYAPPGYSGPRSDVTIFAHNAIHNKVPLYILNKDVYGFMQIPVKKTDPLQKERDQLAYLKTEAIFRDAPLESLDYIEQPKHSADNMGLDQIYIINLKRRPEKRMRMYRALQAHNMTAKFINAIDGKDLPETYLEDHGIAVLPGYKDPIKDSPMTLGEIGCFLSHYSIWKDVVTRKYKKVLILEDDAHFGIYFRERFNYVMKELEVRQINWDLVYLVRQPQVEEENNDVAGTYSLVWPDYSHLAVAYILNGSGARKLVEQKPLPNVLPVDEYLPIMSDKHPSRKWKKSYTPRNLVALATRPNIVKLGHYMGDPGYISDTEDSPFVQQRKENVKRTRGDADEL